MKLETPDPRPRPLDHLTLLGEAGAPALVTREGELDFAGLNRAVGALANHLQYLGAGARVASWLPKSRLTAVLPLACARAGLVHVPINPLLKRAQVAHILADSGATALLSASARIATLEPGDAGDCRVFDEETSPSPLDEDEPDNILPPSDADPDSLAALLYTSGSTGRPKGVMLSHANLWLGAVSVAHYLRLTAEDRVLAVLPLSFDYGQNQLFSTWAAGASVVPLDYLAARDVIRAVERHRISTLAGVPPLWVQLIEAPWPAEAALSLRRLTNSGGKLAPSVVRRMRELFPAADIYSMYGLTEAFRSTSLEPALLDDHPDSMGKAIPFAEIMVVDGEGKEAGEGELVHAGPLVAQGYWQDPDRTAERFKPAPAGSTYGGMAVWSGDRVRRDAAGLLYFVGREDGMIKTAGNRVSPTEVEEAALASGLVAEAVALGYPDPRLGEGIALIVRPDRRGEEAALRAHLKRQLPNFMQPGPIIWRDELPRSPNGKLDRVELKNELMA